MFIKDIYYEDIIIRNTDIDKFWNDQKRKKQI